jgi:hypothetical protein
MASDGVSCAAYRALRDDSRRAAVSGLTFRGKEDPRVDTDYHLGVGFRGRWRILRP